MNSIHHFTEPLAGRIEIVGGKGANLALLTQRGFPVPPGFTVSAKVYRDFISPGETWLRDISTWPFHDAGRIQELSEKLQERLSRLSLPQSLAGELEANLARFPTGQSFSVRSSSTMEDLASAAFAGQHETFLNCRGAPQILEKIKECFLSLWSARAIAYRQQQGFDHRLAAMAVVVQEMIPCEVAGVGFSINPVSGDLNEMVFDANFGLGESVVSGEGAVDHFTLEKSTRRLRESRIATKTGKIIGVPGGTAQVELGAEDAGRPCLTGEQLDELAQLLICVEQSFSFPQDIEWGFAGGRLFLLQSRPITTIPPRWTRDESAERFPNVITPLTWDFVESGFHRSLNHSFRLMGFPPCHGRWFAQHGHYIYGNQNAVEIYGRRAPFRVRSLDELRNAIPALREEFRWVQELPVLWARDLDSHLVEIGAFMAEPLEQKNVRQLWEFVLSVNEQGAQYFLPNIAISIAHSTLYRLLQGLLPMGVGPDISRDLFDGLMAFCETKTGTINKELFELAATVRANPALEKLLRDKTSREIIEENLLAPFPEVQGRLQKFLKDHGHREMDFDAYAPTWVEVPWVVLDSLRLILQMPMDQTPAQRERELKVRMQQAEHELFRRLPSDLHFFFGELVRLARVYSSLDDLEHYQTTRLTPALRRGLRELGRRLVERNILREPMDIFFARQEQIDAAILADNTAGWSSFSKSVREQKDEYLRDQARKPEWVLGESRKEETMGGDFLSGLAGSAGQAEGAVFIVLSPEDFARFPKGSVLVARTTNPTWTPLFYSAAAVVTESGGPLSHGAVTAREMRIPAVMSVQESLSRLKNGQRVRVDGTRGRVHLLPDT